MFVFFQYFRDIHIYLKIPSCLLLFMTIINICTTVQCDQTNRGGELKITTICCSFDVAGSNHNINSNQCTMYIVQLYIRIQILQINDSGRYSKLCRLILEFDQFLQTTFQDSFYFFLVEYIQCFTHRQLRVSAFFYLIPMVFP